MITKENLQEIAGVSFDDILTEATELLTKRKWNVRKCGTEKEMEVWLKNKSDKIAEMVKSPYYNGNLQLIIPAEIYRSAASNSAKQALNCIRGEIYKVEKVEQNENGQTAVDRFAELLKDMPKDINPDDVYANNIIATLAEEFNINLQDIKKKQHVDIMYNALSQLSYNLDERISENMADELNYIMHLDKKKVIAGQKTSKVVSRILHMGKYDEYNGKFTLFADLINGNAMRGYYVVSLNFLDYLRMSDGHSWSSCHTTDPHNTRGLDRRYEGQYVQGCLSYANDKVTYMTYFIGTDADVKHPDRTDKLYRQCMHVREDNKIYVNGRVYPQGNDGQTDIYTEMNKLFSNTMGFSFQRVGVAKESAYITTNGANYPDYYYNRECKLYTADGNTDYSMTIGNIALSCRNGEQLNKCATRTII